MEEITRDELNKMIKKQLMDHLEQHGMTPNSKNIRKPDLIDLTIKGGFNRPPPPKSKENDDEDNTLEENHKSMDKNMKPIMPIFEMFEISSKEVSECKSRADVDDLVDKKIC